MSFSVLLSVYNKENPIYFEESLKSIINQSLVPSEIVLVKDGPLNAALDKIVNQFQVLYPNLFQVISLKNNVGLGEALRIGVEHCSNEIVARMDTDDISLPFRFERQINIMESDPTISVLGSWIAEFDDEPSEIKTIRKVPLNYEEIKKKARYRNPLNHMSVVFRKSAVIEAGNYKPFLWNEDYYLWVRMLIKGFKIVNLGEILLYVRAGEAMFNRRGGLKYLLNEVKLQKEFLDLKFTSTNDYVRNIVIRGSVRVLPNKIRGIIYKSLLRSSH
ncbi:glycosyltransferase [Neobacillus pocheonensis]|uniref:glycosyltransferase n=1 Tax=Neobacillus pocheonensis TaxID=363869 RepID=UPI003D2DFACC